MNKPTDYMNLKPHPSNIFEEASLKYYSNSRKLLGIHSKTSVCGLQKDPPVFGYLKNSELPVLALWRRSSCGVALVPLQEKTHSSVFIQVHATMHE